MLRRCICAPPTVSVFSHLARSIKHMHYLNRRKTLRAELLGPFSDSSGVTLQNSWCNKTLLETATLALCLLPPGLPAKLLHFYRLSPTGLSRTFYFHWLLFLKASPASEGLSPGKKNPWLGGVHWTKRSYKHLARKWFGWTLMFFIDTPDDSQVSFQANSILTWNKQTKAKNCSTNFGILICQRQPWYFVVHKYSHSDSAWSLCLVKSPSRWEVWFFSHFLLMKWD